ncbi:MAG: Hsp70 family protein [Pirellulales bacterium]|nr:Hsp70 family protein [Pirellulales bacterium]
MTQQYSLGIDLGTTNSVLAYTPLDADQPQVSVLPVPQLTAAHTVEARSLLPSFLYLGLENDAAGGAFDLPWSAGRSYAVGEYARRQGAEVPDRTVGAAKSWLCHRRVDRRQPILPWNAPDDVPKISPLTAAQRYLEHLAAAWNEAYPDAPFAEQSVVLTVPASFDASARELTREAALAAGFPREFLLLEEPQAAVYAWLDSTGPRWRKLLAVGDSLLVCDVGGGTTDLTLIGLTEEDGQLQLQRIAVGNHLLVGGDNMDLALAHYAAGKFAEQGVQLDPWQSVALWHSCRTAKEILLAPGGPEKYSVAVPGRGRKLIGSSISVEVQQQTVGQLLLEGFFPPCPVADRPRQQPVSGFREIGLPFESDPAVTRHLAAFLQAHGQDPETPARPTHVLFNGGVFKADRLRDRLLEVLSGWFGKKNAPRTLEGEHDLDHAAARGAAYYGWSKNRGGLRIRAGAARGYYVGIETSGLAVPGAPRPLRALCVVPIGMEEGSQADVPGEPIGLVVGQPAHFRFFSSSIRKQDRPGDLLPAIPPDELIETDALETQLPIEEAPDEGYVPVKFQSRITELGVLELWCVSTLDQKRWKLEFSVREEV